jgi:hypothetical protein
MFSGVHVAQSFVFCVLYIIVVLFHSAIVFCFFDLRFLITTLVYVRSFMVFNATFNNISVISRRSAFLVGETVVSQENQRPVASH